MKKVWLSILVLVCVFALTACDSAKPNDTASQSPSGVDASDSTPDVKDSDTDVTDDVKPGVEIDNSETEIRAIFQEYEENDVVEILQFSYDGQQPAFEEYNWRNPELELMNNDISAGPLKIYQDFLDGQLEDPYVRSIDIRSYAFDKDEFLQIVTTCVVYPETIPDLYTKIWSYNFSIADNRWIQLDEVLEDYSLTAADIEQKFIELYTPSNGETILGVNTAGFLINRVPAKPVTHFLLEVMLELSSDPYIVFFMYTPDNDEFEELDITAMFSPDVYDMAELEPPLMYSGGGNTSYTALGLTVDTTGLEAFDESTYTLDGLVFVEAFSYPPSEGSFTKETLEARVREIEGDDIQITALALYEPSEPLSYPVWRVDYIWGSNEDTTICSDLFMRTDIGEYRVRIRVAGDWEEDYRDEIERILASVNFAK